MLTWQLYFCVVRSCFLNPSRIHTRKPFAGHTQLQTLANVGACARATMSLWMLSLSVPARRLILLLLPITPTPPPTHHPPPRSPMRDRHGATPPADPCVALQRAPAHARDRVTHCCTAGTSSCCPWRDPRRRAPPARLWAYATPVRELTMCVFAT